MRVAPRVDTAPRMAHIRPAPVEGCADLKLLLIET